MRWDTPCCCYQQQSLWRKNNSSFVELGISRPLGRRGCQKGVVAERHVVPKNIFYGGSDYHSGQGDKLFLSAYDLEKETTRHFLIEDIIEIL